MTARLRHLPWATLALVGAATATVELAARPRDDHGPAWIAWTAVELLVALIATAALPRLSLDRAAWVLAALTLLLGSPFALEPLYRVTGADGRPLEVQMLAALRNLALGLLALASWPLCRRLAAFASVFLLLFAVGICDARASTAWLTAVYAVAGVYWLMAEHWRDTTAGAVRLPMVALVVVLIPLAASLAVAAAGPTRVAAVLAELLPTSGGTGEFDPFARGGVNDGDDETRGTDKAKSTGFAASDVYLDSPLPSLYDVMNDMYGEPYKPREVERSIALSPEKVTQPEQAPADNLRPNREFAASRRPPNNARQPLDRSTDALFQVRGRVPLHVRGAAYDLYDGRLWHEAPEGIRNCLIERETPPGTWFHLMSLNDGTGFAAAERHELRTAKLRGRLVPTPPQITRFRVGKVDRAEFFGWSQERVLVFANRETPSGVTVETDSRVADWRALNDKLFAGTDSPYAAACGDIPPSAAAVRRVAAEWAGHLPRGRPQLAEIVRRLRSEFALDRAAGPPPEVDPHAHFLIESKRGSDYQFAGSAVLLLRSLGYRSRLVSGWYVDAAKYDLSTGHTPAGKYDVHFWPEVLYGSAWLPLEPTPGYELLAPAPTWWDRLTAFAHWLRERALPLNLVALVLAATWSYRHYWMDQWGTLAYRWRRFGDWRERSWAAWRLIERRAKWAGRPRPAGLSPNRWSERFGGPIELARLNGLATYAPAATPPPADVIAICQSALAAWTVTAFREAAP